jgi:hypothetical protein
MDLACREFLSMDVFSYVRVDVMALRKSGELYGGFGWGVRHYYDLRLHDAEF